MIMVGQPHYTKDLTIKNMANNFIGKTIKDSQGGLTDPAIDIPRYIELYINGKLDLDRIITNTYRLEDINQAIDNIKQGIRRVSGIRRCNRVFNWSDWLSKNSWSIIYLSDRNNFFSKRFILQFN